MFRFLSFFTIFLFIATVNAADLNPKAINIQLPKDIKWVSNPAAGSEVATVLGDPNKPGLYIVLQKWLPHHNSRPHYHNFDRYIYVIQGTWWVQTGPKYDMEHATAVPAGSYVTHYAKEIHYDGAKDEPCILEIVGMGPAQSIPVEEK
jgi:quercetin dioxygenase-like cupin family protein